MKKLSIEPNKGLFKPKKTYKPLLLLFAVMIIAVVAAGFFFFSDGIITEKQTIPTPSSTPTPRNPSPSPTPDSPNNITSLSLAPLTSSGNHSANTSSLSLPSYQIGVSLPKIKLLNKFIVNASVAKIWAGPTTTKPADLLTEFILGDQVTLLSSAKNRIKVQGANYTGWIDKKLLISQENSSYYQSALETFSKVVTTSVKEAVLYFNTKNSWSKLPITYGTILPKLSNQNGWVYVVLPNTTRENNLYGVIRSSQVESWTEKTLQTPPDVEKLIKEGQKFLGKPYTWGGTSSISSVDCSGLWYLVFRRLGYLIPRDASVQKAFFESYEASYPYQRGDIIYYGTGKIDHTAVYLGQGKILHSTVQPSSSGIMVGDLADGGQVISVVRF